MEAILKTPRFATVENNVFIIPSGFLYASIYNTGGAGALKITTILNEEVLLNPGDVFDFLSIGYPYSQIRVDGTNGAIGKITYIT